MVPFAILLFVLALVFGGLGLFVAKAFLFALAMVLIAGILTGELAFRGH